MSSPCELFVYSPVSKDYEAPYGLMATGWPDGTQSPIYVIPVLFYCIVLPLTHLTGFLYKILEISTVMTITMCMHSFIYSRIPGRFKTLRFGKSQILALPHSAERRNCFLLRRIRT